VERKVDYRSHAGTWGRIDRHFTSRVPVNTSAAVDGFHVSAAHTFDDCLGSDIALGEPESYDTLNCEVIVVDESRARADCITRAKRSTISRNSSRENILVALTVPGWTKVDGRKLGGRRLDREVIVRWRGPRAADRGYAQRADKRGRADSNFPCAMHRIPLVV
jgi:hypothetical protein